MSKKFLKFIIDRIGYQKIKNNLRKDFIDSILYPFALSGHISAIDERFLGELVREARNLSGPIIEVGTLFGYSTLVINNSKDQMKKLITIDNFRWNPCGLSRDEHYHLTSNILKELMEFHNVHLIRMDKNEFYKTYKEQSPSLVFLDADHSYAATLEDILWAKEVGSQIICGHDYGAIFPEVIQAVNEVCNGRPSRLCGSIFVL